jgi:hypothetical protein
VFTRQRFSGRVEAIDFFSQFGKFLRIGEEVEEERSKDRLRSIGSSYDDKVSIIDDNLERYILFLCAEFVGL